MRDEVYKNVMRILRSVTLDSVPHSKKCMELLQKAYPMIPELTLESIYTLYYQRRMRIRHFKCKEMADELYHRYNTAVANGESGILLRMSLEFDLAPALLARLILDQHCKSDDNQFNKCISTVIIKKSRQPPSKLRSTCEESSASHSLSEETKSSDNTVSEASEDISVEECSEEFKLSDEVLQSDAETTLKSTATEAQSCNDTILPKSKCRLFAGIQNGKLKPQENEKAQISGDIPNERLILTDNISSMPNGYHNISEECSDKCNHVSKQRDVSSSKPEESAAVNKKTTGAWRKSQVVQDVQSASQTQCKSIEKVEPDSKGLICGKSAEFVESQHHSASGRSELVTTEKQESCSNAEADASGKMDDGFRDELQELKNKLVQLKIETKKLITDRPTGLDETGIEISGMRRSISRLMKDTTLIQDKVLAHEVSMCVLYDDQYGPAATTYKHSLGQEYEVKLVKHAEAADLTFHLEARLRERGFDKTPDLLLVYPIAIGCNVVNWIESKALFADREVHSMYFVHQYERYCSRYGPGLVIYWFGFVESLREDDPFILIRDNFPKYIKHMNLLVDDASDCEAGEESGVAPDWEVAEPSAEEMTKFLERFSSC